MGQEVYRGWPGGGSRAVRDVLCGKDVHSVTTRDRKLQISLIFVTHTIRIVRFDNICNRTNVKVLAREIEAKIVFKSGISGTAEIYRRQNSFSMPQRKTKNGSRQNVNRAESSLRPLRILQRSESNQIFCQSIAIYRVGQIVYNENRWVKIDSQAYYDNGTRLRRAQNIQGIPKSSSMLEINF